MTLVEIIVAVSIFTLATFIVGTYAVVGYRSNRFVMQQADAIDHARRGLDAMEREIREASVSDLGSFPVVSATSQSFTFYGNTDADAAVERVRYFLSGTDFARGQIKATGNPPSYLPENETVSTLARYVQNGSDPIFYYYNGDFPSSTAALVSPINPIDVKLVELQLKVNIDPLQAPEDVVLSSYVQIRNVKDNL